MAKASAPKPRFQPGARVRMLPKDRIGAGVPWIPGAATVLDTDAPGDPLEVAVVRFDCDAGRREMVFLWAADLESLQV